MEPTPLTVSTADVTTDGPRAEALESVLVRADALTVMEAGLAGGEFTVDDMLHVDDQMFAITPAPVAGQMFDYIQGPLGFGFGNTKIEPRDVADVGFGSLLLAPADIIAPPGGMVTLTVVLPMDAPAGGAMVTITPAPATILTGPAAITVPEGMRSASAMYTAQATEGMGMVTASYGGEMDSSTVTVATAPVLFFSEYVEGNSNNKAMEIVNAGGSAADLSMCAIRRYTNGSTSVSATYDFPAMTLAAGDVFVVCNGSLEGAATLCDDTSSVINHNGDDAYDLFCAGMVVDTFGQIGTDPGTEWSGGGLSTLDYVLQRACTVTSGDMDGSDAFDPSVQWTGTAWVDAATSLGGLGNRAECP
ncbi:MAG: lamin tail domain-containing protein [Sandaracinaceae bacterium]